MGYKLEEKKKRKRREKGDIIDIGRQGRAEGGQARLLGVIVCCCPFLDGVVLAVSKKERCQERKVPDTKFGESR